MLHWNYYDIRHQCCLLLLLSCKECHFGILIFFPTMSFTLGIRPFEMDKPIKNAYIPKTKKKIIMMTYFGARWPIAWQNKLHGAIHHTITCCVHQFYIQVAHNKQGLQVISLLLKKSQSDTLCGAEGVYYLSSPLEGEI